MSMKKRAPSGLSEKAKSLWRDTIELFDLDEHEYPILESACRELDLIAEIEKELRGSELLVMGSMGQDVANPLLTEVRMHRRAYIDFMKALNLPESDGAAVHDPRRAAAQKAANARWSRGA